MPRKCLILLRINDLDALGGKSHPLRQLPVGKCTKPLIFKGFLLVRPAWAHTCGCKSRCELVTASKVKRNCVRATERGKEAWSINREPMNKNRIEGGAKQGERARNREALVTKARRRKCGGCAMKVCVLTWGDLASWVKARRHMPEREVSSGRSSRSRG